MAELNQPPLILTLQLDKAAFTLFNGLRKKHFPPAINYLDAHLTLFHHLPNIPAVTDLVSAVAGQQSVIHLNVSHLMKLGRGVAFGIKSDELLRLHQYFQRQWPAYLTPQDRQGLRPHVTVQNKVTPETANSLFQELSAKFEPFAAEGIGLSLWAYQGGPWEKLRDFPFLSASAGMNI